MIPPSEDFKCCNCEIILNWHGTGEIKPSYVQLSAFLGTFSLQHIEGFQIPLHDTIYPTVIRKEDV